MQPPQIIASLDEALPPGAESLLTAALPQLNKVAIGIVRDNQSFIRLAGEHISPDSVFQLASMTKVYNAELLGILLARGTVRLDDPIAKFLPGRDPGPNPITLLDLATHLSGLPRLPPGLPLLAADPYAKYSAADLEKYLAESPLQLPAAHEFRYSNLGFTILGYVLSRAAGLSFSDLLTQEILAPLGLTQTTLALEGAPLANLLHGHTQAGIPTGAWTFDVCAPCGGLCSTIGDQLKFLAWLLADSDRRSFQPQASIPGGEVGLGWMVRPGGEIRWHNGATFGFSSWISLNRARRFGVVILSNRQSVALINTLGTKLESHLDGLPVTPLKGNYGRARSLVLDPIRVALQPVSPILSPFATLPALIRFPIAAAIAYGAFKLAQLFSHR